MKRTDEQTAERKQGDGNQKYDEKQSKSYPFEPSAAPAFRISVGIVDDFAANRALFRGLFYDGTIPISRVAAPFESEPNFFVSVFPQNFPIEEFSFFRSVFL